MSFYILKIRKKKKHRDLAQIPQELALHNNNIN